MDNDQEILKKIALLESSNDQLQAEKEYINALLVKIGFPKGLKSVKEVGLEILNDSKGDHHL